MFLRHRHVQKEKASETLIRIETPMEWRMGNLSGFGMVGHPLLFEFWSYI